MTKKIKILVAEHDQNDLDILAHELIQGEINYESKIVQNEQDYIDALKYFIPDIILSDYSFPAFDGPTAFKIREEMAPDTPFIFVSGTVGEETAVELIKNGLTDYALKDKLFTLPTKINRALKEKEKKDDKTITDEKLYKAVNLYAFISQINKNIVRVKDASTLFRNSCQLAIEFGKFKIAWIGMFNTENKKISLVEQCGINKIDLSSFTNMSYPPKAGIGHVMLTGQYFVSNDIKKDCDLLSWDSFAAEYKLNSCMVLPIRKAGKIVGTFNLYSTELNFLGKEDIHLLEEVANDISFALDLFSKEKKQKELEGQQVLSQASLLKSEARLKEAQKLSHISNWEMDLGTNICTWSDEFYAILGAERNDIEPSSEAFLSFIHLEDVDRISNAIKRTFETLEGSCFYSKINTANGLLRYVYSTWKFEFNKDQKPIRLYGILQDITEAKLAEKEREKMISNLIQNSKKLEQFAFIVSHNLRGPVANILGISNLLKNDISEADKVKGHQFIFTATEHLDQILKDLNKVLEVKSEINESYEMVNLHEVVEDIKSTILNPLEKNTIEIITDFKVIDNVISIKSYIHSIFYNLISNGMKYRKQGSASVLTIKSETDHKNIRISFKDNGVGIDLIKHGDHVFKMYKRFHENINGKGLGLFMVSTQIESLGGTIRVESTQGNGAEFIIELPL